MTAHSAGNEHTTAIASFVSGLDLRAIPAEVRHASSSWFSTRSAAASMAPIGLDPHSCVTRSRCRSDPDHTGLGNRREPFGAACGTCERHLDQGFELDDVHRQGVLHVGAVTLPALFATITPDIGTERPRSADRDGRRLRNRPARRHLHGPGAHWPGLAFRRDGRRVFRRCRRRART